MNNIIQVAENRDEIMARQDLHCPLCLEKQFSPFDKLYASAYEKCIDCSTINEVETLGENIFAIL